MNLEKSEIRSILAEIYKEACLLEGCDMRELAILLEDVSEVLYEFPSVVAWQKLRLDKQRFDHQPYLDILVKFRERTIAALNDKTIASIHILTTTDKDQAFHSWFEAYVDALVNWEGDLYGPLCQASFDFTAGQIHQLKHYRLLNQLILDNKWPETYEYFEELAENLQLSPSTRASFMVYAGQVMLYHLNNQEKALALFEMARTIDKEHTKIDRAFGEFALVNKDLEKARTHFLNAISRDANHIENYLYMGDTYLEEKKWNAAEQWYNDALQINFIDLLPFSRLITLYGEEELIEDKREAIDSMLDKAMQIEKDTENENITYNLYRDAGFTYSKTQKYKDAVLYYQKAIALKPDLTAAIIDLAYILAYDNQYAQAKEWFNKSIAKDTTGQTYASYWGLGWLYEQTGEIDEAIASYEKCVNMRKYGNDRVYNILGILNYNREQLDSAKIYYKKAITDNPSEPIYYDNLKKAIEKGGDQQELKLFFDQLAAAFPQDHNFMNEIGVYYHHQSEYTKAISFYDRAISLEPNLSIYWENRGLAYEQLQEYDKAEKDYLKALELGKGANLINSLGVVKYRQKDFHQAKDYFMQAIELDNKDPIFFENLGLAYENLGDVEKAEENFMKALQISKEDARYMNRLGLYYQNCKLFEKALDWYSKAAEKDKENYIYKENVAIAHEHLGHYEKAEELYQQMVLDQQDELFVKTRLLNVQFLQGKYFQVLEEVDKLLTSYPDNLDLYEIKGSAYEKQFLYEEALQTYEQALKIDPDHEYFNNRMGVLHYYLGTPENLRAALQYYGKAIKANPNMKVYYNNLELVHRELGDEKSAEEAHQKANGLTMN